MVPQPCSIVITFIVGLPASGKTTYARTLPGTLLDDFASQKSLSIPKLPETGDLVLTDPKLCHPFSRGVVAEFVRLQRPVDEFRWIFFANDPAQCLENSRAEDRGGKEVDGYIRMMTKWYTIPEGAETIPVWRPAK